MLLHLLRLAILHPEQLTTLGLADWDRLLPAARRAGLLGRLHHQLHTKDLLAQLPAPVRPHLQAAAIVAENHTRLIHWEVNRIEQALRQLDTPVILLKGAAYALAKLPFARGRLSSDVDILVPKAQLSAVETALQAHGWQPVKLNPYDQRYYRRWMHELPPLRHQLRGTVIDVHHTILPETSRLHPDPAKLLAAACPLPQERLKTLAPADMVLHSTVHAFHDGDLSNSLRDLIDLHGLLSHFGAQPGFWETLVSRAAELHLSRPLYYALRYGNYFLHTAPPATVTDALHRAAPPAAIRALMDALMRQTLLAAHPYPLTTALAYQLLYMRSHWLRMPPWLLAGHLLRKTGRRLQAQWPTNQTAA